MTSRIYHFKISELILLILAISLMTSTFYSRNSFAMSNRQKSLLDQHVEYHNILTSCGDSTVGSSDLQINGNKTYKGTKILSDDDIKKIKKLKPFYEKAIQQTGSKIKWQLLAVVHRREAGLARSGPSNGQGPYQDYERNNVPASLKSGGGWKTGKYSDSEFLEATVWAVKALEAKAKGLGLGNGPYDDNAVKKIFFAYNGMADVYKKQALNYLGMDKAAADRGEGSPYVMNLADEKRDSSKHPEWKQILHDHGSPEPANQDPGAFLMYAVLGGSDSVGSGSSTDSQSSFLQINNSQKTIFDFFATQQPNVAVAKKLTYSKDQVESFMSAPLNASFGVSDEQAEKWVMSHKPKTFSTYGVTESNIHKITEVLKEEGVSPAFFYLYAVNEGSCAGRCGFINHYGSSTGDAVTVARKDARYLNNKSKDLPDSTPPATGGGGPSKYSDGLRKYTKKLLKERKIGGIYLASTSAVTAEIDNLLFNNNASDVTRTINRYGYPIQSAMSYIKAMGGDPTSAGSAISADSDGSSMCSDQSASSSEVSGSIAEVAKQLAGYSESNSGGTCYLWKGGHSKSAADAAVSHKFYGQSYGVDCSGFVSTVLYKATGEYNSYDSGDFIGGKNFKEISKSDLQPGDIVVWPGAHVAIYLGPSTDGDKTKFQTAESSQHGCGKNGNGPSIHDRHYTHRTGVGVRFVRYTGETTSN